MRCMQSSGAAGGLFIGPNIEVYEGQIVGLHSRGNDLVVNPTKAKQLTNVRASGTDDAVILELPRCGTVWSRRWSLSRRMSWWRSPLTAFACVKNCFLNMSAGALRAAAA